MPESPREIMVFLQTQVQQLAVEAVAAVKAHIQNRPGAEGWIRQGLSYGGNAECPFCGQDTSGVQLVKSFSSYFSDTYDEKIVQLQQAKSRLEQEFGDRAWARVREVALENDAAIESWADLSDLSSARMSLDRLENAWRHLVDVLGEKLKEKLANPTQALGELTDVKAALRDYDEAAILVRNVNADVQQANERIAQLEQDAASADDAVAEQELRRLRNSQIRQDRKVQKLCDELVASRENKAKLAAEKRSAKEELEAQASSVLEDYQTTINGFLERSGASVPNGGHKADIFRRKGFFDVPNRHTRRRRGLGGLTHQEGYGLLSHCAQQR